MVMFCLYNDDFNPTIDLVSYKCFIW